MRSSLKVSIIWIVIISIMIFSCLSISRYLEVSANKMLDDIIEVEDSINNDKWEDAYNKIVYIGIEWEKTERVWSTIVNHHEIDSITISLIESEKYVKYKDKMVSETSLSSLKHYIDHIPKMELLNLKNVL